MTEQATTDTPSTIRNNINRRDERAETIMKRQAPTPTSALFAGCTGSLLALVALVGLQAAADQDPTTDQVPRQIPYHGTLTFEGEAVSRVGDSAPWIRFELTATAEPEGEVLFTQEERVDVHNGRFSVTLGELNDPDNNLNDVVIEHSSQLYIHITLLGDDHDPNNPNDSNDVKLSNPQLLGLSPLAMWATNATHFDIADSLTVRNTLNINNTITMDTAGDLVAAKNLDADGDVNIGGDLIWNVPNGANRNGKVMSNDSGMLVLNPDRDYTAGTVFNGSLSLDQSLTVGNSQGVSVTGSNSMIQVGDAGGIHQVVFGETTRIAYETSSNDVVFEEADGTDEILRINRDGNDAATFGKLLRVFGNIVPNSDMNEPTLNIRPSSNASGQLTFSPGGSGLTVGSANNISFSPSSLDVQGRILRVGDEFFSRSAHNGNYPNGIGNQRNLATGVTEMEGVCFASRIVFHKMNAEIDSTRCSVSLVGTEPNRQWYVLAGVSSLSHAVGAECAAICIKW